MKKYSGLFLAFLTSLAFAADGPDFSKITGAIDFGSVVTAILAVMGLLAGVFLAIKGGKIVLNLLKGG